jgi:O-antigen/teichoic acid export membrane protein
VANRNPIARSAIARVFSFVPTAIASILTSRLIIDEFGIASFNSYALILSLIFLLPLNNLGVGAAVTQAYAAGGPLADHSQRVTLTAARVLVVSSVATATTALLLGAFGLWEPLLGAASGPNLWCGIAVAVFALGFVPGLAINMLLGVHRNDATIVIQIFFIPLILLGSFIASAMNLSGNVLMVLPSASLVVINVITAVVAARSAQISWLEILRKVPSRRTHPGASIKALAGPFLIMQLTVPIAVQSDRIVLSHVSTDIAVASYSVAVQIFAPVLALIGASAQPLWPIYTAARSKGEHGPGLKKILLVFAIATAVICSALIVIADPLGTFIGAGRVDLGWLLPIAAALAILMQAIAYPLAMYLIDPPGVRFIAIINVVALPVNIGLSILFATHLGAAGPLFATALTGFIVLLIPAWIYIERRQRAEPVTNDDVTPVVDQQLPFSS